MSEKIDKSKYSEAAKVWTDYLKHLSTLSTGSILLIVTFLDKLFQHPQWKAAVITSLIGFLLCVLGSAISFLTISTGALFWQDGRSQPDIIESIGGMSFVLAILGFSTAMIALSVFAVKNLI